MRISAKRNVLTRTIAIGEFESVTVTVETTVDLDQDDKYDEVQQQLNQMCAHDCAELLVAECKAAMRRRAQWPEGGWKNKAASTELLNAQRKALTAELHPT